MCGLIKWTDVFAWANKAMITSKEDLERYLAEDSRSNSMDGVSCISYALRLMFGSERAHIWRYIKCLRLCEYYLNTTAIAHGILAKYYRLKLHRLGFRYGLRIPPNVCDPGIMVWHLAGGGCFVNAKKIGRNCRLQTGVVIGAAKGSHSGNPVIGDNVEFGPGAKVLGGVTIGHNVFVASNAVVVNDIPDNCLVGGVPAKVIKHFEH